MRRKALLGRKEERKEEELQQWKAMKKEDFFPFLFYIQIVKFVLEQFIENYSKL